MQNQATLTTSEIRAIRAAIMTSSILTGNERTTTTGAALRALTDILAGLGFSLDLVSLLNPSGYGSQLLTFRRTHPQAGEGYESPVIENCRIAFSWMNLMPIGFDPRIESIAYIA